MSTEIVHVGFGSMLAANRIVAIASPAAASIKRLIQESKAAGNVIDITGGRCTKAVLVLDSGHVALAAIAPGTIARRVASGLVAWAAPAAGGYDDELDDD
jgi:regulator of extracellular matrix RemA (YlzA/DUF370 family)